jgi:CHAD domain-containing protein
VELVTDRHVYHLVGGDRVLVEVVDDRVTAHTPDGGAQSWREVEAELVDGDVTLLDAVVGVLMGAGAAPAAGPSKLGRALGRPIAARAPVRRPRSAAGLTLAYLRAQVDALVDGDARVRLDLPDAVHGMRVATRRLRSTLATHRRLLDHDLVVHLRGELRHLGAVLGAARDAEVLRERILADLATLPADLLIAVGEPGEAEARVAAALDADVVAARDALLAELDSERHLALLDELEDLVHLSALPDPTTERPVARGRRASVRHDLRRARRALRVAAAVRGTAELAPALHEVRKAAKRARYAAELAAPAVGDRALRLVERLTALQDLLGAHQDDVVARERLRRLAAAIARADGSGAPLDFALGVLHERATGSDEVAYLAARRLLRDTRRHWPA